MKFILIHPLFGLCWLYWDTAAILFYTNSVLTRIHFTLVAAVARNQGSYMCYVPNRRVFIMLLAHLYSGHVTLAVSGVHFQRSWFKWLDKVHSEISFSGGVALVKH